MKPISRKFSLCTLIATCLFASFNEGRECVGLRQPLVGLERTGMRLQCVDLLHG